MAAYDQYSRSVSTDPGSVNGFPNGISSTSASGGPFNEEQWTFYIAAGSAGADDVTLFNATLPVKCFITAVRFFSISTVSMGTVTLRTASGGGGSALSAAVTAATAGAQTNSATALSATALAANSSIFCRRSDGTINGVLTISYIPTV